MTRTSASRATGRRLTVLATAVLLAGATQILAAAQPTAATTAPRCAGLDQMKIPASVMSLPTTGGRVESTTDTTSVVSGETIEYCQVDADIFPVDPAAPDIKMRVDLPYGWNHKALMFGGGGFDGSIPDLDGERAVRPDRPAGAAGPGICDVRQRLRARTDPDGPSVAGRVVRHERRGPEQLRRRRRTQEDARREPVPHPACLPGAARPRSTSPAARPAAGKPSSSPSGGRPRSTA